MRGFSIPSLVLGYFLVGGGLYAGLTVIALTEPNDIVSYLLLAAGTFAGGFVAARTSRGSTIIEPTLGAVAMIATIVGLAAGTSVGEKAWYVAAAEPGRFVASVGLVSVIGALMGSFVSERVFGEATTSWIPWILYAALSVFGGSLVATMVALIPEAADLDRAAFFGVIIGGIASGVAVGASARVDPTIAGLVGGVVGALGFVYQMRTPERITGSPLIVIAIAGGVTTMIGAAGGWRLVGRQAREA